MAKSKVKDLNPEAYKVLRAKWASMITRCTNSNSPNYKNYGGRGITVCNEWRSFANFFIWSINNGFKIGLSIDRIDTNKNYCPNNCRFITIEEQQQNRRNNRMFIDPFDGQELCLAAIAKKYNIPEETFRKRIDKYKMDLKKAIAKPIGETKRWNIVVDLFDNERLCLTDLARKYEMNPLTLRSRINKGLSLGEAITKPIDKRMVRNYASV